MFFLFKRKQFNSTLANHSPNSTIRLPVVINIYEKREENQVKIKIGVRYFVTLSVREIEDKTKEVKAEGWERIWWSGV